MEFGLTRDYDGKLILRPQFGMYKCFDMESRGEGWYVVFLWFSAYVPKGAWESW